jgi:ATP-dependent helicase/nuclease subunit A
LLVDWPVELPAPQRVAFVASESRVPPSLSALYAQEQAARAREELNGLYVAMTRAREWLVFSHTEPHRALRPSWQDRVAPAAADWAPAPVQPTASTTAATPVLVRVHPGYEPPAPQRASAAEDPAAAALGQAVHRLLEWVGQPQRPLPRAAWPEAARAAAAAVGAAPAEVLGIVQAMMAQPACARFFLDPGLEWAGAEVPLAVDGDLLRVDRLVAFREATGRHWWVLDFKLHPDPQALPAYREQLQRYRTAVQALQAGDRVSAAWITARGEVFLAGA